MRFFISKDEISQVIKSEVVHNMEEFGYRIQSVLDTNIGPDAKCKARYE